MTARTARPKPKRSGGRGSSSLRAGSSQSGREPQVNIRFPEETRDWLELRAGDKRAVPAYVRDLVERERAREQAAEREKELLAMFNRAAEDLTEEDREERRLFMQAHPNRG